MFIKNILYIYIYMVYQNITYRFVTDAISYITSYKFVTDVISYII